MSSNTTDKTLVEARAKSEHQRRVRLFMRLAGQDLPEFPVEMTRHQAKRRLRIFLEEVIEKVEAAGLKVTVLARDRLLSTEGFSTQKHSVLISDDTGHMDLIEFIDACADCSVVNAGDMLACGVADVGVLEAVDNANLNKFKVPTCRVCAPATIELQRQSDISGAEKWHCVKCGSNFSIEIGPHMKDGKWMKPPNFMPPDIKQVLKSQGYTG